ncbi:hypothetical protein LTR67_008810 [Exophiala xenobiotica]
MLSGYVDLQERFPVSQGLDVFDHTKRNIMLETWLANTGRLSDENDNMSEIIAQFHRLRIDEQDFLPGAPRSYPPGIFVGDPVQHQLDLNPTTSLPDENFKPRFPHRYGGRAPGWPRQKSTEKAREKKGKQTEASDLDDDDEEDTVSDTEDVFDEDVAAVLEKLIAEERLDNDTLSDSSVEESGAETEETFEVTRANIARGRATCYVSSAVQILHNVQPLAGLVKSITKAQNGKHSLNKNDPGLKKHNAFLDTIHTVMDELDNHASHQRQVPVASLLAFLDACDVLAVLLTSSERWKDGVADSTEFLVFILERLNAISGPAEGGIDSVDHNPLEALVNKRRTERLNGVPLPRLENDIDQFWTARKQAGHMSEIDDAHIIQTVTEQQCDSCGFIVRLFDFQSSIILPVSTGTQSDGEYIDFKEVRKSVLEYDLLKTATEGTRCPSCQTHGGSGYLVKVKCRVVNEPDLFLVTMGRSAWDSENKQTMRNIKRLRNHDGFDLKDWSPPVFSDPEDLEAPSVKYTLIGVLFYGDSPPHYIPIIRLGRPQIVADQVKGSRIRYGRLNDGSWVEFDDLKSIPNFKYPHGEMPKGFCETLLIFRKDEQAPAEPALTGQTVNLSEDAEAEATQHATHTSVRATSDPPWFSFSSPGLGGYESEIDRRTGADDHLFFPSERDDDMPSPNLSAAMNTELPPDNQEDIDMLVNDDPITFEGEGIPPRDPALPSFAPFRVPMDAIKTARSLHKYRFRSGERFGFGTLAYRQKGHDEEVGASDTWKATEKTELELERANNRFVAETFTKNKKALRMREEELARQKAELAEAMSRQKAELAAAISRQKAEFAEAKALLERQQQDLARREARVAEREAEMAEKGAQVAEREAQVAERETRVGELINSLGIWHEHFGQQFDALRAQSTPSAVPTIMTTPAHPPFGTTGVTPWGLKTPLGSRAPVLTPTVTSGQSSAPTSSNVPPPSLRPELQLPLPITRPASMTTPRNPEPEFGSPATGPRPGEPGNRVPGTLAPFVPGRTLPSLKESLLEPPRFSFGEQEESRVLPPLRSPNSMASAERADQPFGGPSPTSPTPTRSPARSAPWSPTRTLQRRPRNPLQIRRPKTSHGVPAATPDRRAATSFGDHPTSPLRPGVKREAQSPLRPGPPSRRTPAQHGYSNIINIAGRRQGPLEMEYFIRRHGVPPRWEPASKVRKEAPELVSDYDDKHPEP